MNLKKRWNVIILLGIIIGLFIAVKTVHTKPQPQEDSHTPIVVEETETPITSTENTQQTAVPVEEPQRSIRSTSPTSPTLEVKEIVEPVESTEPVEDSVEPTEERASKYQISYVDDDFDRHLLQVMSDFGINLDVSYIYATIYCESTFRTSVKSSAGAIGYMQVIPSTRDYIYPRIVSEFPQYSGLSKDLRDPYTNVVYGLYYFRYIAESFGESGVNEGNLHKVLTCYNRGVGGGKSYLKRTGSWSSDYSNKIVRVAKKIRTNGGM